MKNLPNMAKLPLVVFVIAPYLETTINGFQFRLLILEVVCNLNFRANFIVNRPKILWKFKK